MSANKTKSSRSSGSGEFFPILLLGALGVGVLYYFYQNSDQMSGSSGSFGSSSSGDWYDMIGGAATNSERAISPAADTAGWGAGSASATGSTGAGSAGVNAAYIADVKKSNLIDLSGDYRAISQSDINAINQSLANLYAAEGRSESAFNFVAVPSNAAAVATVKNTGISNAGSNLTSIVNSDGSYNVYDWRGNIVSSGSAGAFNEVSKKAASVSSSGSSSSGSSGSKNTVNIIADKSSVIRSSSGSSSSGVKTGSVESKKAASVSSGSSSGKITGTATIGYSSGSSSSGSSGKKYTH